MLPELYGSEAMLEAYLGGRGLSSLVALENGWYFSTKAGDHHARVVIPCTNTKGYVYWQARAIDPSVQRRYQSPSYASSDSLAVVWPTHGSRVAALVEGPMDALAAAEAGVVGVATMGKRPSDEQLAHFVKLFASYSLLIIPDRGDIEAGSATATRLALGHGRYAPLVVPLGKDLAALPVEQRRGLLGH